MQLNLMWLSSDASSQVSDTLLKLVILSGVDKRVNAAVGQHHYDGEMIEPAGEVDIKTDVAEEEDDLIGRPAYNKAAADQQ